MVTKRNIIFDTGYFMQKHFHFNNQELKSIEALVKKGYVNVYLTDITIREIRKKIVDQLTETNKKLESSDLSYLKIMPEFIALKSAYSLNNIIQLYEKEFASYLSRNRVQTISSESVGVLGIFEDYCNLLPPFNNKKDKKAEFPDAFSLAAIANWAKTSNETATLISTDGDWKLFAEKYDVPKKSEPTFAWHDEVVHFTTPIYNEEEQLLKFIGFSDRLMLTYTSQISKELVKELQEAGYIIQADEDVEYTSVFIESVDPITMDVLSSDSEWASYSVDYVCTGMFEYSVADNGEAFYDKEEDRFIGTVYRNVLKRHRFNVTAQVEISFMDEDPDTFQIEEIDVDRDFTINYDDEDAELITSEEWDAHIPVHVYGVEDERITEDGKGEMYFDNIAEAKKKFPLSDTTVFVEGEKEKHGNMLVYKTLKATSIGNYRR